MYITGHEKLNKLAMYVDSYYTSFGDKAFVLSMNFAKFISRVLIISSYTAMYVIVVVLP